MVVVSSAAFGALGYLPILYPQLHWGLQAYQPFGFGQNQKPYIKGLGILIFLLSKI